MIQRFRRRLRIKLRKGTLDKNQDVVGGTGDPILLKRKKGWVKTSGRNGKKKKLFRKTGAVQGGGPSGKKSLAWREVWKGGKSGVGGGKS